MSQLLFLGILGVVGLALTLVVTAAPIRSRFAAWTAAMLAPTLGYVIWRVVEFIAPMGFTLDARDPVGAFDLWMVGAVALLGLALLTCLVRVARVTLRARPALSTPR